MSKSKDRIPVYFSHSYRADDRELNEFFWKLLYDRGFAISVDPKSETLSVPFLEWMMKQSACFAAVITVRPEQPRYRSSPFIVFEYGLAVQAQKPRLVFIEQGVGGQFFEEGPNVCPFNRERLEYRGELKRFDEAIERLAEQAFPYRGLGVAARGQVGIILPNGKKGKPSYSRAIHKIKSLLDEKGFTPKEVDINFEATFKLALDLDEYELLILDVGAQALPDWVYPFIQGRFIPSVKLFQLSDDNSAQASIPRLAAGQILPGVAATDEPILFWRDEAELLEKLTQQLDRFDQGKRAEYKTFEEGARYFRNLGRSHARVFISNAHDSNDFSEQLSATLDSEKINYFQYTYHNTIELGKDWEKELNTKVRESKLFIMIITEGYWQSNYCKKEYELAKEQESRGQMTIVPYYLEFTPEPKLPQGKRLDKKPKNSWIKTIVSDLDGLLRDERIEAKEKAQRKELSEVDVAIITILPEEYEAVYRHLENAYRVTPTQEQDNPYAWQIGEVSSETYQQPYHVALAMAGEPGTQRAVLVTQATIERWNPRYLLVVGIAGGLQAEKVKKGDVVVSDDIWNYEYGKYEEKYSPRQKYRYRSDTPIITAAQALEYKGINWRAKLKIRHPEKNGSPSLVVGPVASGDKVIDDLTNEFFQSILRAEPKLIAVEMEGAGAGAAIKGLHERGRPTVGFAMIRGISDLPRARAAAKGKVKSNQTAERDAWKKFAAEGAACFAVELIRGGWPVPPRENYR